MIWELPIPQKIPVETHYQYPRHNTRMADYITYRISDPNEEFDWSWVEKHGRIIMKSKCEDGLFILLIKY